MKSLGTNIHNYEPDFWEFQYEICRYLGGMDPDQLAKRYRAIVRNFHVFVRPESDVIPIECLFGSWYWYRKEHQRRCLDGSGNLKEGMAVRLARFS
jgi:hypothetical protein